MDILAGIVVSAKVDVRGRKVFVDAGSIAKGIEVSFAGAGIEVFAKICITAAILLGIEVFVGLDGILLLGIELDAAGIEVFVVFLAALVGIEVFTTGIEVSVIVETFMLA